MCSIRPCYIMCACVCVLSATISGERVTVTSWAEVRAKSEPLELISIGGLHLQRTVVGFSGHLSLNVANFRCVPNFTNIYVTLWAFFEQPAGSRFRIKIDLMCKDALRVIHQNDLNLFFCEVTSPSDVLFWLKYLRLKNIFMSSFIKLNSMWLKQALDVK